MRSFPRAAVPAVLSALLVATAEAACPGPTCTPGGGRAATDCVSQLDGVAPNAPARKPKRLRCEDGDPTCDTDGTPNGACRVLVAVCLNVPDPALPACTPTDVASFTVRRANPAADNYDPALGAIAEAVAAVGLPTSAAVCTDPLPVYVALERKGTFRARSRKIRTTARTSDGRKDPDTVTVTCVPSPRFRGPGAAYAGAKVVTAEAELVRGPLARGRVGDVLLESDKIRVVIQAPGRSMFGIGPYGGTIIDADRQRPDGEERDSFEELAPLVNVENTLNYTDVTIVNDGSDGRAAVVRATGRDDLLDYVNPSTIVADAGFAFPPSLDDRDLPIEGQTDYVLEPGATTVRIETTLRNTGGATLPLLFGDIMNGSGQVELFQDPYGFGEPLVTTPCPAALHVSCLAGTCDPCDFVAWSGDESAAGVSYGYVHGVDGSTTFTTSGVTAALLGNQALLVLVGLATPNYALAPAGSPGDALTITRHFVVGDGSVRSVTDARNALRRLPAGTIIGTVTEDLDGDGKTNDPVANADVAVVQNATDTLLARVVTHARTDANGEYRLTVPAGTYAVRAHADGRLFPAETPDPVTVRSAATVIQDFLLERPGRLAVTVTDEGGRPIPAKVQLVGFDPSPDPERVENVFGGIVENVTHVFGDQGDPLPYGIAGTFYADRAGTIGEVDVEPGRYQVVVSHGTRYSHAAETVTIEATALTTVAARLARTVDTPGFVASDFHLHALDSPDSEVSREGRVESQLAEGIDFFTPSEHDIRVDFQPIVAAMGVADLVATAPSAEITTFDYGHFNSWPVTVDAGQVNGGSVDWGRPGIAPGRDFPALGSFGYTPAELFAAALADPRPNLIQVNHVDTFFGPAGLQIDTGLTPPRSFTLPATRRLDPAVANLFDDGFQALEVWNGNARRFLGENAGDWFNLLNQGVVRTAVATSDSHEYRTMAGGARSYVAAPVTDPALLAAQADALAASVVAGRVVGTNGPFVRITAAAASTGQQATLALGSPTRLATTDGRVDVTVTVESPRWAPFDTIELYVNGATQPYDHDDDPMTPNRYRIVPTAVRTAGTDFAVTTTPDVGGLPGSGHLTATTTFALEALPQDAWVLAMAKGTDGVSLPLFPIVPDRLDPEQNPTFDDLVDGNLGQGGDLALAFTNPLFLDVDGDGTWTAPGVQLVAP